MKPYEEIIAERVAEKRAKAIELLDVVIYSNPKLGKEYTIRFLLEQIAPIFKQDHDELENNINIDTFIDILGWADVNRWGEKGSLPYQNLLNLYSITSNRTNDVSKIAEEALDPKTVNKLNKRLFKIVESLYGLEIYRKELFASAAEADVKMIPDADLDKKVHALRVLIERAQMRTSGAAFEERHATLRAGKLARIAAKQDSSSPNLR